ncbi:sensor histidine kinase [Sphaerisporangium corydalis]|uniref:histidine kinase n=1 Tax=Sphaerisporangium corydalis TaxID=1441875 RepID=A0ABV9EP05_9ACTN|nr:histidine kinase [Sphaerisporangium corydalis]
MDLIGVLMALGAMIVAFLPRARPARAAMAGGAVSLLPRARAARAAMAGGAVSLAFTAAHLPAGTPAGAEWGPLAEAPPLLVLVTLAVRRAPVREAAIGAGLAGGAVATILLRVTFPGPPALVLSACAGWSLGAVAAAGAGLYLRFLDGGRRRAVARAERSQRLALARDLHDFVAHDVSGMLVRAQAALFSPEPLPPAVADALRRIEEGGRRALASLDRSVQMLGETDETGAPGIEALRALAAGFSPSVRVNLSGDLRQDVSRETSVTVHRVVSEALTNVRRHAPGATTVDIALTADAKAVHVRVTDDGRAGSGDPPGDGEGRSGGFGLAGLDELLRAAGGSLTAGPGDAGWHVTAVVPR